MTKKKKETIDREQLIELIEHRLQDEADNLWDSPEFGGNPEAAKALTKARLSDPAHLDRILVARKYETKAVVDLFWEQIRFQSRVHPLHPSPTALKSGAWRLCGHDRHGHVLSNYKLEFWNPDEYHDDLEQAVTDYTKFVCYMIELMIESSHKQNRFSVIFDLNGFYYSMVTKNNIRMMIRKLIYVAQAQYPERLEKVYLINAPYGFSSAWSLLSVLLDAKTAAKIHFCSTDQLLTDIDPSVLSVEYGGNHPEYPLPSGNMEQDVYTS
jgi:hypothetical protein